MNTDKWIFPLAVCFMCVSSNDDLHNEVSCELLEVCETHTVSAPLGSSVLLPCTFANSNFSWVSWAHTPAMELVHLNSKGSIKFLLPKSGRVKAFPNQGSEGNYSICIDELQYSDLGCYYCKQGTDCLQVELVAATDADTLRGEMLLLIYICVGVAAFILLSSCSYLFYKNRSQDNTNNPVGADIVGASAPPAVTGIVTLHEQQRGADNSNLVYENDDQAPANQPGDPTRYPHSLPGHLHDVDRNPPTQSTSGIHPNLNQCNFERAQSQRTKHRFHRELINRLRQASFSRHYYANQGELRQQGMSTQAENPHRGFGKKKAKENHEYNNPIYNRSTDQLNHL
ncbi:uncharacterized protein LOC111665428 isoform X2 [Seriola lalandi dorsalis]|uniref:uncharacterized protein LOC111665428 isoform X2 n=1 Tax=Seriola lalandi dorsalis TaxID=1841481 RepID=UPI000C6F81CD|nr:uncharacterized protein LOC111665428 isoform X2 [Seriola lalandi dorsalis]